MYYRDKLISLDEYLDDGGWEGDAKEEWRKEFLDNIDTSKDGFLDRDEVAGTFSLFQWMSSIVSILSKMTFYIDLFLGESLDCSSARRVPRSRGGSPGGCLRSQRGSDSHQRGGGGLSKISIFTPYCLLYFFERLRMLTRFSWAHKPRIMGKALFCMKSFDD